MEAVNGGQEICSLSLQMSAIIKIFVLLLDIWASWSGRTYVGDRRLRSSSSFFLDLKPIGRRYAYHGHGCMYGGMVCMAYMHYACDFFFTKILVIFCLLIAF
jgi:hypothetical protein